METLEKINVRNIVYCVNLDKRDEKGKPEVSLTGFEKGNFVLDHDSRNDVLQVYISIIENGAEKDLYKFVIAPVHIGTDRFLKQSGEWEKPGLHSKNYGVEVH